MESRDAKGEWQQRYSPPLRSHNWPIKVDDAWSEQVTVETRAGQRTVLQVTGRVVSYESISVPAGSFMTFKSVLSVNGRLFREVWYAPETRTVVRSIIYDAKGNKTTSELTDYLKDDEPVTAYNTETRR